MFEGWVIFRLSITSFGRDFCFAWHNQSKTLLLLSLITKFALRMTQMPCGVLYRTDVILSVNQIKILKLMLDDGNVSLFQLSLALSLTKRTI